MSADNIQALAHPAPANELVRAFYERIWNAGDLSCLPDLLSPAFVFKGSLGDELEGWNAFGNYVRSVRSVLAEYRCEILGVRHRSGSGVRQNALLGLPCRSVSRLSANRETRLMAGSGLISMKGWVER